MGDRKEDCECEAREFISPTLDEFFRVLPEVVEPDLSLREKRPMLVGFVKTAGPSYREVEWMISDNPDLYDLRRFSVSAKLMILEPSECINSATLRRG
jgi:hypothetical protein